MDRYGFMKFVSFEITITLKGFVLTIHMRCEIEDLILSGYGL